MNEIFKFLGVFISLILGAFVFIGVLMLMLWPLVSYDCKRLGENVDRHTEYYFFGGGCLVDVDGELIPDDQWFNNTGN